MIATLAVMLAAGAGWAEAIHSANIAAGIVVGKLGTAVVTREELAALPSTRRTMYTVTGAAGFIGSNLVKALNERGVTRIIAMNIFEADKFKNLIDCEIADYIDKNDFIERIQAGHFDGEIDAIFHEGACSDTMEADGRYMMENNYRYSMILLDWCQDQDVFLASSAATYGGASVVEAPQQYERLLDVEGCSEFLFSDRIIGTASRRSVLYSADRRFPLLRCLWPRRTHRAHGVSSHSTTSTGWAQRRSWRAVRRFSGYENSGSCAFSCLSTMSPRWICSSLTIPKRSSIVDLGCLGRRSFDEVWRFPLS